MNRTEYLIGIEISFFPQALLAGFSFGASEHDVLQVGKFAREPKNSTDMLGNPFCKKILVNMKGAKLAVTQRIQKKIEKLPREGPRRYTKIMLTRKFSIFARLVFFGKARGGTQR